MKLYLLRHGIATLRTPFNAGNDAARRLTSKGEKKIWRIAEAIGSLKIHPELILSSPYVRARETAAILGEVLMVSVQECPELAPEGKALRLMEKLFNRKHVPETVFLVGHEPDLSQLASFLLSSSKHISITLKKGGLCRLNVQRDTQAFHSSLEWLLPPKVLECMV